MFKPADGAGEILQKVDIHVEADDEGLVFGAQRVLEEGTANFLFHIEDPHLAAARIGKDAEGQREIGCGFEGFDGLGLAVRESGDVCLGTAGAACSACAVSVYGPMAESV